MALTRLTQRAPHLRALFPFLDGRLFIEQAEREGKLKPGGTIVEPTSGNTGVGLAIAAAGKGYRCVFVMPDKMSQEKISMLRAYGAEVVICPTAVPHDSPESYYSVSDRLAEEIPGGFKPDQYSNMANPEAHYRGTGPEIWEQTGGEIDAIVISVGTGGTISGVGRYFKERKPEVLIVGADPEGSVYTAKDDNDLHPYLVEGIGKDTWPKTMDPEVVDEWIRVSDRESFQWARRLAREEGILAGGSGGTATGQHPKIGLVTDIGGLNDRGFNHLSYVGLQQAIKKLKVNGRVYITQTANDRTPNLTKAAQAGYGLVIPVGVLFAFGPLDDVDRDVCLELCVHHRVK